MLKFMDKLKRGISLNQAAELFPRRPHIATMHRWCLRGCRGIKLRSWMVGGIRHTDPDAVEDFLVALNRETPVIDAVDSVRRSREAGQALEALGG